MFLQCWNSGAMGNSAIYLEDYNTDAGDKTINILLRYQGMWPEDHALGLFNSEINLGNGNDSIGITVSSSTQTIVTDSYLIMGGGDDTLDISGNYQWYPNQIPPAMDNVFVNMGEGNDYVHIHTDVLNSDIYGGTGKDVMHFEGKLLSTLVDLGGGNDVLRLHDTTDATGSTFDGGGNDALNYARGKVGDVLSLDEDYFNYLKGGSMATVRNFEALHVDFKDGSRDSLNLDTLLNDMNSGSLRNDNFTSLILTGDTGEGRVYDSINFGDNATLKGSNISVEGMEGQFSWYTANAGTTDQLEVFVATGMLIV